MVEKISQWHDRKKKLSKPLFPSYIFVKHFSKSEYHKVLSIDGVYNYLKFGGEYAAVTDKEMMQIRLILGLDDVQVSRELPSVGEMKKITYGILKDLTCEILEVGNERKILVRIDSIHQNICATLPSYMLSGK